MRREISTSASGKAVSVCFVSYANYLLKKLQGCRGCGVLGFGVNVLFEEGDVVGVRVEILSLLQGLLCM